MVPQRYHAGHTCDSVSCECTSRRPSRGSLPRRLHAAVTSAPETRLYIARAPSSRLLATTSEAARAVALIVLAVALLVAALGHPLGVVVAVVSVLRAALRLLSAAALRLLSTRRPEGRVVRRACLIVRIWGVVLARGVVRAGQKLGG